jgi:hypothetical protein
MDFQTFYNILLTMGVVYVIQEIWSNRQQKIRSVEFKKELEEEMQELKNNLKEDFERQYEDIVKSSQDPKVKKTYERELNKYKDNQ